MAALFTRLLRPRGAVSKVADLLGQAADLRALGRHADAMDLYERALAMQPGDPEILTLAGTACGEIGDLESAASRLEAALEASPGFTPALAAMGNVYQIRAEYGKAEACYRRALETVRDDPVIASNLALVLAATDRLREARDLLEAAVEAQPDFANALVGLGRACARLGDPDAALAAYDRARECAPDRSDIAAERADVLASLGRLDEALRVLDGVLAAEPAFLHPRLSRGAVLERLERHGEALAEYEKAAHLSPDHAPSRIKASCVALSMGDSDAARRWAEQAYRLAPDDPLAFLQLVHACPVDPDDPHVYRWEKRLLGRCGEKPA